MVRLAPVARSTRAGRGVALRGLLGRAPTAAELVDQLARLGRRIFGVAASDEVAMDGDDGDATAVREFVYPMARGAEPVRVAVRASGDLAISARTSTLGPGYHLEVTQRLASLLDELDLAWVPGADAVLLDPANRDAVEAAHLAWLVARLRAGEGKRRTRIGMGDAPSFHLDAPIHTAMGPRDEAWRAAVLADPRRGADAFPWWGSGPGDAARSRALRALWFDVPWREPLDDDERALLTRVDADLRVAYRAEPRRALPWPAWAELQGWLDDDDAVVAEVARRAGDEVATIGYRRWPMTVDLSGGWSVRLPGDMVAGWDEDGGRLWATNGAQAVEFVSVTAVGQRDPAALLAAAPERHPVSAHHAAGGLCGRVEHQIDDDVHLFHGIMAAPEAVALLTLKGEAADEAWAIEAWRSLRWSAEVA